ncbi:MAG: hypothetical protein JWP30_1671 [Homoserinimonas sp.]|jgi:membrane protein implicated in regulation of membrane protease activity|nr:hypothetical protein [Homoserinimonas sp.]
MVTDFLADYAWIVWLALILIFVIVEVMTLEFTFLMLAFGSVGGLVADLLDAPVWAQIILAGILAILLLFLLKPAMVRKLQSGGDPALSNIDALLGTDGTVLIEFAGGHGRVKLANGETWTARLSPLTEDRPIYVGERVVVTAIDGATAVVVPTERNAQ